MKKPDRGHPVAFFNSDYRCSRAYLLAGGESRRMGRDKLFLPFGNQTLLERMCKILSGRFDSVKIAARSQAKFANLPYQVLVDSPKAQGPMAGLISIIEDSPDQTCFVCAVDLPDLSAELIDRLLTAYQGEDYLGVEEALESEGGPDNEARSIQPLCGIWSKNALPRLLQLAASGNYRLADLLTQLRTNTVAPLSNQWRNLNYPADLDRSGATNG